MNRKVDAGGTVARKGMVSAMLLLLVSAKAWSQTTEFSASGGTVNGGSGFTVTNAIVASPAGVLNVNCSSQSNCTGGTLTIQSNDGLITLDATFTSGSVTMVGGCNRYGCSYYFTLTASLSGTLTANGQTTSITGDTAIHLPSQRTNVLGTSTVQSSSTFAIPAYSPMFITDAYNNNIARTDDFTGTNYTTFGSTGSGIGHFISPWGVSVYGGKIYIADSGNNRLVRMDDMKGTNWTTFGTKGAGIGQFNNPTGLFIDQSSGEIYITDSGNARIVRMDDFTGTRWLSYGVSGTGTGQFNGPVAICLDAQKRIYVADEGNSRVVRFDDMSGTNFSVAGGVYFSTPSGVGVDGLGKIYITDLYYQYVYRMDDITGTNTVVYGGPNFTRNPYALFVDSGGTFYTGDYDAPTDPITRTDTNGQGFATTDFGTSSGLFQPVGIFMPLPPPGGGAALKVSAKSLAFGNENIHTTSAPQAVTLTNIGSAPLSGSVSASANFAETDNCANLAVGASCTIDATFAPTTTGPLTGTLTLTNNAVNNPPPITLTGTGTAPVAGVAPAGLTFFPQLLSTTSAAQTVVLSNSGTGPLTITSIAATGDFSQTNNCGSSVAPGVSCTISVSFTPQATGTRTGTLVVTDNDSSGSQTVNLSGTGSSTAPTVTISPASLVFPAQLVNTRSAAQTVTVTNNGKIAVAISGFATSGDFSQTNNAPSSLAAGKSCTIRVTFTPTATGTRTGSLTFTLPTGSQTVALTGTGTPKGTTEGLTVSPTSLAFGNVALGDSPSQTVTLTNNNGVAVGIGSIGISGSTTFTKTKTCGSTLAAGATCTITVTFTPTSLVAYSGSLNVTESSGAVHKVTLSGTGSTD
jgi:Abnormal spindle-like microcephaly-assoc'd, ASPM-SPD-2-Hydin/NHL repeat